MFRLLKDTGKRLVRSALRLRLGTLPLTERNAEWWADQIKRWPAVLGNESISRRVRLDHDIRMDVGLVDVIERNLWVNGAWDRPVKHLLEALLQPGDQFLDLGANIGYFTLMASKLVGPTGTVVAVEPSIRALRKLTHHVWLNGCSNVLVVSSAAGTAYARAEINLATESNIGGSSLACGSRGAYRKEPVLVMPLDDLLEGVSFQPKLIKVDVEGCELAALHGVRRLLQQHRPWVACEVTEEFLRRFGHSARELLEFMADLGYQPFSLESKSGAFDAIDPLELEDENRQFNVVFGHMDRPVMESAALAERSAAI